MYFYPIYTTSTSPTLNYIHWAISLYYTKPSLFSRVYIIYKVSMYKTYYIYNIIILKPSIFFSYVIWLCDNHI